MSDEKNQGEGPDVSAIDLGKCKEKEFPGGKVKPAEGGLRVALGRRAYDEISRHAQEDTEHEIGGVLLGTLCKDAEGPFLHITEIIRGEHTASQGAQVTFKHETWNHFHNVKDKKFPDLDYLGWYHSHPDFGIFLSAMDEFIQKNFFGAPHQVALVVDPLRHEEGLFCWKQGEPARAEKFWVGKDSHRYEPAPEPSAEQKSLREIEKKLERVRLGIRGLAEMVRAGPEGGWMQSVLLVGILLLLGYLAWTSRGIEYEVSAARVADEEDVVRRHFLNVEVDRAKDRVELRYRLPPPSFEVERLTDPFSGMSEVRYRVDRKLLKKYVFELRKKMEAGPKESGNDKKGAPDSGGKNSSGPSGQPEVSPVGPAAGGGSSK
jgi:proteasome lid subunit RPN8/RPN11